MKFGIALIGATALSIGGASSGAQIVVEVSPVPTERVSFADLNITSASGKAALEQRIRGAARRVCIVDGDLGIENAVDGRLCFKAAVNDGFKQMNQAIASTRLGSSLASATLTVRGQ